MNNEDNKQECKVAKSFIQPEDIQQGDLIKVKYTYNNGSTVTRRGVASSDCGGGYWYDDTSLPMHYPTLGATVTVELIDRPKPKIELPTDNFAVIEYYKGSMRWVGTQKVDGDWALSAEYFYGGFIGPVFDFTAEDLTEMLNDSDGSRTDYAVLFAGVAK